jgi:stage V sporulation protein D (sporulation-specific penicillin-binding protein)
MKREVWLDKQNRTVSIRVIILAGIFGLAMFVPLVKELYEVSIVRHEELERKAIEQATRSFPITAGRGTIYDRNKNILAMSAGVETVCVSPRDIARHKDSERMKTVIADGLSSMLDVDRDMIVERMGRTNRQNEIIKTQLELDKATEVREFINENKLAGMVFLEPGTKRYYPNGYFAANVIGFVGADNTGLMGVEAVNNHLLTGTPGRTVRARTGSGAAMPNQYEMYYDAMDGYDLYLTIDETIQHFAEKHLETAVIENEVAERGCAIVMDVKTGAILAMATKGDFDLNEPRIIADEGVRRALENAEDYSNALEKAQQAQWRNKAVNDTYEPGSVFKVFTAAMAIEENLYNLNTASFGCGGSVKVGGFTIRCHRAGGHGSQTFLETLTHSCNPAYITIGNKIGPQRFYDYMRAFGFMNKTGIDLQGEAGSLIAPYSDFSTQASAQAVYSFGQTFKVTPIQMLAAINAVGNGGRLMKPYVLSHAVDSDGRIVEQNEPALVRQVISENTSKIMREYMEECVNKGTGSNAYVKGYNIAGKTGTSQKRDIPNSDALGLYVVSFAGFAPAHDPKISVIVLLDEPGLSRTQRMGGYMAAPVAGRIFSDALPYLGVIPRYKPEESMSVDVTAPFVKRLSADDAKTSAERAGLSVRVVGDGTDITDQLPAAGVRIPMGTTMILYTEGVKPSEAVTVPDVRGLSPERANRELTNAGVFMRPIGAQSAPGSVLQAAWQEYAGLDVPYGTVIMVEFRRIAVSDTG